MNVLFIGNSFTARNDLPGMLARLAGEGQLSWKLLSIGGASLRTHWNKGDALREIRTGGYDAVVLQEQSTLPIKNAGRMRENVLLFDEAIRAAGAKTVLYMTWARRHAPGTQQAITDAYTSLARELNAGLIPAGIAWQKILTGDNAPLLHDRDGSHPTVAGTYVAACCAYAALFGRSPLGLAPPDDAMSTGEAKRLQQAGAWAARQRR
jgi:hypothetical protein